jgi:mannose-6-phosphate isomerase-like protein (cupin superfamily)
MKGQSGLSAIAALIVSTATFAQTGVAGSRTHGVQPPGPPVENGVGQYWSDGDQRKALSDQTGPQGFKVYAWTPGYRVALRRVPDGPGIIEMHEDKMQLYVILSGSGTQVMGGKPKTIKDVGEGNHTSPDPLEGGKTYHLKPGDMVIIPPLTWHQTGADAGQSMTYRLIDIPQSTRMP